MKAEDKQALIELNRIQIACWEMIKSNEGQLSPHCAGLLETHKIALAALTAQPIGRVDRGAATDSNEYPGARVICLHEHVGWEAFQDGAELFTRPAPAVSLAELVPDEMTWNEAHSLLNINHCGEDRFAAFMMGANYNRNQTLRNIEEANK